LTDYVKVSMSAAALGEVLTNIGLNCDGLSAGDSDVVYELDVTSNRPDWLGHVGVAREVSAATGAAFTPPVVPQLPATGDIEQFAGVQVEEPVLCPRYTARLIRGVKVGPSPAWLVERLESVGLRSVNNIVDVTNFVLFEYSQPLHSFDYDKLVDHRIIVRRAREGEMMVAIDGTKCQLDPKVLVIADAQRPVAIAGVMGGQNTEVTERTTSILLESAQFDQLSVRRTSRKLGIMSDSNYRFERGVDPVGVDEASRRACQLILQVAGGELVEGVLDVWAKPFGALAVALRPQRTDALLGVHVPQERQLEILNRLCLSPKATDGKIVCTIPPYRRDIYREIDLIEEIARIGGLDRIPVAHTVTHSVQAQPLQVTLRRQVGHILSAAGFDEALSFTFVDKGENELFGVTDPIAADTLVRKTNNYIRATLAPSLLRCFKNNQDAGNTEISLYELAKVFPPSSMAVPAMSSTGVSPVSVGAHSAMNHESAENSAPISERQGHVSPANHGRDARATHGQDAHATGLPLEHTEIGMATTRDLRDLRGAVEALLAGVAPQAKLEITPKDATGFDAQASAAISIDGKEVGKLGMIAASVLAHYGLERPVAVATLDFDALLPLAGITRTYQPLPRFPAVTRDLSLIVDEPVTWRELQSLITGIDQPMRSAVEYVTTYRGKPIAAGKKSVTITLTYRSTEGTLRSQQVDEQVAQVVAAAKEKLGAELRT
jgi:phenylalanyl-tRNA synthetase beta chain